MASAVALNYFIRFRYLEVYTTLKEPPLVKSDAKELHPDVNTGMDPLRCEKHEENSREILLDPPPPFHNYLDDFLQAVRVFGFVRFNNFASQKKDLLTTLLAARKTGTL